MTPDICSGLEDSQGASPKCSAFWEEASLLGRGAAIPVIGDAFVFFPAGASASASLMTPKGPPTPSPVTVTTGTVEGGGVGCPLPTGTDPFPFLAQEQALPFGNALPPGLLPLGSFPFSLTLGPETPLPPLNLQEEPDGQPLLPLVLPSLDLLQQPSGLLASLLALPEAACEGQREAATTEPLLEPFASLPETLQPLLFPALSTPPAVLALNSALLATGLGPSDTGPSPTQVRKLSQRPVAFRSVSFHLRCVVGSEGKRI